MPKLRHFNNILVAFSILFLGCTNVHADEATQARKDMSAFLKNVSERVNTIEIWQAYQLNEVAADTRFIGKSLAITGNVTKVVKAPDGTPVLQFDMDGSGVNRVDAYLNKNQMCVDSDGKNVQCSATDVAGKIQMLQSVNMMCLGGGSSFGIPNMVQCMVVPRSWTK